MLTIANPSGGSYPTRLVALRDGGIFSNDKFSEVASGSNSFIIQDRDGISVIDVEKKKGALIQRVEGNENYGMFIEKREKELVILTSEWKSGDKRNFRRIELKTQ